MARIGHNQTCSYQQLFSPSNCKPVKIQWRMGSIRDDLHVPAQDEVIAKFEARYTEAAAERQQAQEALQEAQKAAAAAEARVGQLLDGRAGLRREAQRAVADGVASQASLQGEIAMLRVGIPASL
jgi:hypothetical protein